MKTMKHISSPTRINAVRKAAATVTATFAIFAATTLTSCVEDGLYDTPHPDKGAVVVNADFSQRSAAAGTIPREYRLLHACCGAEKLPYTMPATRAEVCPELFNPGSHTLIAWNDCAKMTVGDGKVKVDETASGLIEPLPGYLFSARHEIEVAADDTLHIVLPMVQHNRDLKIELTVTEGNPRTDSIRQRNAHRCGRDILTHGTEDYGRCRKHVPGIHLHRRQAHGKRPSVRLCRHRPDAHA